MTSGLPQDVRLGVEAALERRSGRTVRIVSAYPLGGGCINPSRRIEAESGEAFFLKWNPSLPLEHFVGETDGLRALRNESTLRVPEVVALGQGRFVLAEEGTGGLQGADPPAGAAWLLLEFVEAGPAGRDFGDVLGRGLAELHRPRPGPYGWERDNYIGSLPQKNGLHDGWPDFWRQERLAPQLERARATGHFRGADGMWDRLLDGLDSFLEGAEADGASLVHGDLWSGNVYPDTGGRPVLIDPAVYRGHREVDLAMAELFGGFPAEFYRAYASAWPLGDGYERVRRHVYQLYPLLVHVNLFGAGYEAGALARLRQLVGR